jgi:hypothetical protein
MLHDQFFTRIDANDPALLWFLPDEEARQEWVVFHEERRDRAYTIGESPKQKQAKRAVVVWSDGGLPRVIRERSTLEQLELPLPLIGLLRDRPDLVNGLLELSGSGTQKLDFILPGVRSLVCQSGATLKFAPHHLPAATEIAVKLDGPGALLKSISAMPKLVALELWNATPKHDLFPSLAKLPGLRFLRLSSGTLPSLDGIEALSSLTDLHVHIGKLTDISAIGRMKKLERLTIWEAKKLNVASAMDGLARLNGLELFACGDVGFSAVDQDRLVERVARLDLGDSAVEEWLDARAKAATKAAKKKGVRR